MAITHARVYIVRHGETEANRQGIFQGQLDTALNKAGIEQARMVGEFLRGVRFDKAFSSDLSRATKTAETILADHPQVQLERRVELRERYLGELQGKSVCTKMSSSRDSTMESAADVVRRAVLWWNSVIVRYLTSLPLREDGTAHQILITSHGGFILSLVRALVAGRKVKLRKGVVVGRCLNSSVTVIEFGERMGGTLVKFGDVGHLKGALTVETNADETW